MKTFKLTLYLLYSQVIIIKLNCLSEIQRVIIGITNCFCLSAKFNIHQNKRGINVLS